MACVPGTPCFENTSNAYYPQQCNNGWFAGYPIPTSSIQYNGPNLPNSGVDTGDGMNVAMQKLDNALDPIELVQTLITVINQNPSLQVMFCTLVNSCIYTTTTTTTLSPPTEDLNLSANGILCGVSKDWTQETPAEVKCDWLELFNVGNPNYGGTIFKYYTSAGVNVGTQLYSSTPGNPPITYSGNYIYDTGGPYTSAKVVTVTTGVISAIYNLSDLPVCGPYVCPTTTTTTTAVSLASQETISSTNELLPCQGIGGSVTVFYNGNIGLPSAPLYTNPELTFPYDPGFFGTYIKLYFNGEYKLCTMSGNTIQSYTPCPTTTTTTTTIP